ncbi:sensor histidine kinase [Candidatus Magnetobacterium bavaricum]|uniref:histidine kinase n=1 Tax=Candidatus Magnetobacterium bavaricum TaxID=29290 RepID=A0A0F3H0B9_9BACT|nr:sensor histidine kinase [Candidatus Magnetobacterium bavaricum]
MNHAPFFTTKPVGSGAGLGISITEGIVKRHGGTVDITSKPDEGTTVTLSFPAHI